MTSASMTLPPCMIPVNAFCGTELAARDLDLAGDPREKTRLQMYFAAICLYATGVFTYLKAAERAFSVKEALAAYGSDLLPDGRIAATFRFANATVASGALWHDMDDATQKRALMFGIRVPLARLLDTYLKEDEPRILWSRVDRASVGLQFAALAGDLAAEYQAGRVAMQGVSDFKWLEPVMETEAQSADDPRRFVAHDRLAGTWSVRK